MTHPMPRRQFLQLAAAGAGAAVCGLSRVTRAAADDFGGFAIGIQTYSLAAFRSTKLLEQAQKLGFTTLEFATDHLSTQASAEEIQKVQAKVQSLGLKTLSHGVNPFTKDHEANRKIFEFAKRRGRARICRPIRTRIRLKAWTVWWPNTTFASPSTITGRARYNKVADVMNAIKGHHPSIGACADLGHYIRSGEDPVRAIALLSGRLYGVHLKDFAEPKQRCQGGDPGARSVGSGRHVPRPRKAEFPADACLALEYEEKPEDPVADIRECLAAAGEAVQHRA